MKHIFFKCINLHVIKLQRNNFYDNVNTSVFALLKKGLEWRVWTKQFGSIIYICIFKRIFRSQSICVQKRQRGTQLVDGRQTGRRVGRQTGRQIDGSVGSQVGRQMDWQVDGMTGRQVVMQTGRQVDRQIDRDQKPNPNPNPNPAGRQVGHQWRVE